MPVSIQQYLAALKDVPGFTGDINAPLEFYHGKTPAQMIQAALDPTTGMLADPRPNASFMEDMGGALTVMALPFAVNALAGGGSMLGGVGESGLSGLEGGAMDMGGSAGVFDSFGNPLYGNPAEAVWGVNPQGGGVGIDSGIWEDAAGNLYNPDLSTGTGTGAFDLWGSQAVPGPGGAGTSVFDYQSPSFWEKLTQNPLGTIGSLFSGGGSAAGGLLNTLFGGGGSGGVGSWLPGLIGALVGGTQNKTAPVESQVTPWNAAYLNAGQERAKELMGSTVNLPEVPQIPVADDRFLQQAISAAIDPVTRDFETRVLRGIRSDYGDQYGGSRQGIAQQLAAGEYARNAQNTAAQMSQAFYPFMFNTQREAVTWPYEQKTAQAERTFTAPLQSLQTAGNIFGGAAGGGRTATTTMPSTPWWQTALGGGLAAQSLWNTMNRPAGA